jgi:malonyl-CoA/methylmalonyl-CoA synthetase
VDLTAATVLDALPGTTAPVPAGPGDLSVCEVTLAGRRVLIVAFDEAARQGSIGVAEAAQLVHAIRTARTEGRALVFLMATSGIRVTDGTAGIASLRWVLREAEDARLDGVRMLAVILRFAFGGASILAALCEYRLIHEGALFGMSGPRLIAETAGSDVFDAADPAAVVALLGGAARAAASPGFGLVEPRARAIAEAIGDWLRSPPPPPVTRHALAASAAALAGRLGDDEGPPPAGRRQLTLNSPAGTGARDALGIATALLTARPGERSTVTVDTPGHRSTPDEERLVLSEYLAQVALTIRLLHHTGSPVEIVVQGLGGGGIQGALGSGATSVAMAPDARLLVLPPAAMRALGRAQRADEGRADEALATGAADAVLTGGNFYELFARTVTDAPDAACIETANGTILSRAWLAAQSGRYANALRELGCVPGDRVAVQVDKSPHALAVYLACLRGGFVFLPANTAYRPAELAHLVADGTPRVFVGRGPVDESVQARVMTLDQDGGGTLGELAATADADAPVVRRTGDETAALLYTSGTTGRPKGAMLSHRAMTYCAQTLGEQWRFSPNDVLLHALPLFHGHGIFVSSNVALAAGARLLLQLRFEAREVIDALPRATVFMGVPTYYGRLLADERLTPGACRSMRLFTSGSAPLAATDHREFAARTGHEIVERYGATETMILCTNPVAGQRRPGTVGPPLPGVELRIAGPRDEPLPAGSTGMIQVRGRGLFSGYWNLPAATRAAFADDGFFRTGDLGRQDDDSYVTITGRETDLIITGGYNVYPAEVEAAIDELTAVRESAVVAIPHRDFGEAVTAFVVPANDGTPPTPSQVVEWCRSRLANYKVPKQVHVVAELPRNTMGKVLKSELREIAAAAEEAPA